MDNQARRAAIRWTYDPPDPETFGALFETTGWNDSYRATVSDLGLALDRSWKVISAYEGNELVGVGRVVSDGSLHAMIYDLIVRPSHQGQGIGSAILKKLVSACRTEGIRDIQLFSASGKAGFYERHGFRPRPADAPGMELVE